MIFIHELGKTSQLEYLFFNILTCIYKFNTTDRFTVWLHIKFHFYQYYICCKVWLFIKYIMWCHLMFWKSFDKYTSIIHHCLEPSHIIHLSTLIIWIWVIFHNHSQVKQHSDNKYLWISAPPLLPLPPPPQPPLWPQGLIDSYWYRVLYPFNWDFYVEKSLFWEK